jgi:hypothetical protein
MNAASLFLVFALAKIAVLWGRPIHWSPASVAAYFWQDLLVALVCGLVLWVIGTRPTVKASRARRVFYFGLAFYATLNVPVARVLSTPLTWPMVRATSGTLADSIVLYATWTNFGIVTVILGISALVPTLTVGVSRRVRLIGCAAALLMIATGLLAGRHVDTAGLHRNAVLALSASLLPKVDALAAVEEWTAPIDVHGAGAPEPPRSGPLSHLRGSAAGRNVVLISLDSTAAQYLRLYGAAEDLTPHLDSLALSGVVFDNAYAVYPESIKGLFSIVCSTYPAFDTTPHIYIDAPCRPLATLLSQSGYRTALFHSGRFAYLGMEAIVRDRGYHTLEDAAEIGGNRESSFGVEEAATIARALAWIDALPAGQPFFLTYLPIAGHHPYESPAPRRFPEGSELGRYRNALHYADASIGSLIAGLRARGLADDTMWVILGDHGEAMGQHEGNYGHTFFLYEENVRVPFVVAMPGLITHTERSTTTMSLVDTAPTILDMLGIPVPAAFQGRSALDPRPRMALFFTDYSLPLVGLRDGRWKFVHELDSGRSKLFDLERDASERVDVSADHRALVSAYERRLRAWSAAQKSYLMRRDD